MKLNGNDKAQIRWLMGRVHVGTSRCQVARQFLKRSAKHKKTTRFAVTRYALECHEANRTLYDYVTKGM